MKRLLTMTLVALVPLCGISAWAYLSGSRTVTAQARELSSALEAASVGNELTGGPATRKPDPVAPFVQHVHSWARKITFANAAAGIILAALMLIGAAAWQRQTPEPPRRFGIDNPAVQQLHFEVANHLKERRRLEFELNQLKADFDKRLEERTAAVSATYTKLEAELNQRKQSEKTLSQQRQELERSKDVLELHVQARTAELQKLQRRYEHILNSAGEGIYGLDMTGKTTFVNPAAAKLTGYTVEELLGKTEQQTFLRTAGETELTRSRPQPTDTQHTRGTGTTTIVGRDSARLEGLAPGGTENGGANSASPNSQLTAGSGEHTFRRKDGSAILVEYTRTLIVENGKQMGAVVTFKDITERKRAEETLARKAAELARSNAELEQFAYVASHDLQEPLRKIRAFGDRLKATIDQLTAAQSLSPKHQVPDAGNTQHRRRKKSAETQTITRAEASDSQPSTPNPQLPEAATAAKDYMQRMQNAAARMQTLINDLLTFSRVISTTQPFVPVDLAAVTREVLSDLEVRIQQTGAKIEVGDLPTIDADPMQMRQLLQNIIANALKFQPVGRDSARPEGLAPHSVESPESSVEGPRPSTLDPRPAQHVPQIKITAQLIEDNSALCTHNSALCELSIQDNGIGFDEKYTDKIFAMFQRLHGRSEYEGTGVGLAVCRRITDRHSGTITARSKPGEGATFVVRLPVHQVNKQEQTEKQASVSSCSNFQSA